MLKKLLFVVILSVIATLSLLLSFSVESAEVLDLAKALKIQNGCLNYAKVNKLKLAIAIYDIHGNLKSFVRMDDTSVAVSELARWKGQSAANYQVPTSDTAKWNISAAPNIATAMGGIPIKTQSGITIGGIGVSGAESSVDVACGEAGIAYSNE